MERLWEERVAPCECLTERIKSTATFSATFSEGNWTLQAYINSLQSPSQKACGSIGCIIKGGMMATSLLLQHVHDRLGSQTHARCICGPSEKDRYATLSNKRNIVTLFLLIGSGLGATTSMAQRRSWELGKPKHFQMSTQTSKLQTWRTIRIMVCVNFFRMGSAPLESQVSALSHQQRMPDAIRPGRGNQGGERMIDTSTVYYCTVYSRAKSTAKYLFFHQSVVGLLASGCEGTVSLFCVGIRRTARNCYHTLNMSYIWGCLRLRHGFDVASTSI